MATGIVRKIDDLGRIVIPAEYRRTLGINEGDELEMLLEGDHIQIQPRFPTMVHNFRVTDDSRVAIAGASLDLAPGEYVVHRIERKR